METTRSRLHTITNMVLPCHCVCDVGTDHAYVPIKLIQNGVCNFVIATDKRQGPLQVAKRNILAHGFNQRIDLRLGDGLSCVELDECDAVLLCGMGGYTIRDILQNDLDKIKHAKFFIVQSMMAEEVVRSFCYEHCFRIECETICQENNKLYSVMRVRPSTDSDKTDPVYAYASRALLETVEEDVLATAYIKKMIRTLKTRMDGQMKAKQPDQNIVNILQNVLDMLRKYV